MRRVSVEFRFGFVEFEMFVGFLLVVIYMDATFGSNVWVGDRGLGVISW